MILTIPPSIHSRLLDEMSEELTRKNSEIKRLEEKILEHKTKIRWLIGEQKEILRRKS